MNVRRKSLHRRKNCKHAKKRANQRAAKERIRIERAGTPRDYSEEIADAARCTPPVGSGLKFRITIECLTDGERVQFTTAQGPHGFTISPTLAGAKVATTLRLYRPVP